jgi:hypothetical protein
MSPRTEVAQVIGGESMDLHQVDAGSIPELVEPLHGRGQTLDLALGRCDTHERDGRVACWREETIDCCSWTRIEADEFFRVQHHAERCVGREVEPREVDVGRVSERSEIAVGVEGPEAKLNRVDTSGNESAHITAYEVGWEVPAVVITAVTECAVK